MQDQEQDRDQPAAAGAGQRRPRPPTSGAADAAESQCRRRALGARGQAAGRREGARAATDARHGGTDRRRGQRRHHGRDLGVRGPGGAPAQRAGVERAAAAIGAAAGGGVDAVQPRTVESISGAGACGRAGLDHGRYGQEGADQCEAESAAQCQDGTGQRNGADRGVFVDRVAWWGTTAVGAARIVELQGRLLLRRTQILLRMLVDSRWTTRSSAHCVMRGGCMLLSDTGAALVELTVFTAVRGAQRLLPLLYLGLVRRWMCANGENFARTAMRGDLMRQTSIDAGCAEWSGNTGAKSVLGGLVDYPRVEADIRIMEMIRRQPCHQAGLLLSAHFAAEQQHTRLTNTFAVSSNTVLSYSVGAASKVRDRVLETIPQVLPPPAATLVWRSLDKVGDADLILRKTLQRIGVWGGGSQTPITTPYAPPSVSSSGADATSDGLFAQDGEALHRYPPGLESPPLGSVSSSSSNSSAPIVLDEGRSSGVYVLSYAEGNSVVPARILKYMRLLMHHEVSTNAFSVVVRFDPRPSHWELMKPGMVSPRSLPSSPTLSHQLQKRMSHYTLQTLLGARDKLRELETARRKLQQRLRQQEQIQVQVLAQQNQGEEHEEHPSDAKEGRRAVVSVDA
ncbi:hypothetical protein ON010_g14455 [Phytophthora cinnamomi]|nr:hypothetical protein ON010_g14455 [Phytophthora cinnamomi]